MKNVRGNAEFKETPIAPSARKTCWRIAIDARRKPGTRRIASSRKSEAISTTSSWLASAPGAVVQGNGGIGSVLQVDYDNGVISQSRRYRIHRSPHDATQASLYERARATGRDALRATVIEAAGELLATDGPAGLTMRRLAAVLGCTTTVLYTMFASKQGLIDAMYREGFDRLRARMRAIPAGAPPAERLRMSALAYRENALSSPQLYQLTFGPAAPEHTPGPEATAAAEASIEPLIEIVQGCIEAGLFRPEEPRFIAQVLTAAAHGAVSLELSHYFWSRAEAEQRYSTLTAAAARAFTR